MRLFLVLASLATAPSAEASNHTTDRYCGVDADNEVHVRDGEFLLRHGPPPPVEQDQVEWYVLPSDLDIQPDPVDFTCVGPDQGRLFDLVASITSHGSAPGLHVDIIDEHGTHDSHLDSDLTPEEAATLTEAAFDVEELATPIATP